MMGKDGCGSGKLCPVSLGVGFGVAEGIFMLFLAWAGWRMGFGITIIHEMATVFHGYAASFLGGLIGVLWGILEGFVFGFIAGAVYNWCVCRCGNACNMPATTGSKSRKSKSS